MIARFMSFCKPGVTLTMRRAEGEAEGPPPWFGRTKGSAAPSSAPLGVIFLPDAGMIASGVVAMCIASSSTVGLVKAWLAGDGSPLSPYVDSDPTNGTIDFPAMEMVLCRWEEAEERWSAWILGE